MKSRKMLGWLAVLGAVLVLYVGLRAWNAHQNLVTLNVRNLEVRDVVRKIEWQVWEIIYVDKSVEGKITLNVKDMPLEQVLALVAGQTLSRSSVLYPLYSSARSFAALKKSLRGEVDPATSGWTNLAANPFAFGGGPGLGIFGPGMAGVGNVPSPNSLVSLTIQNQDVNFAAIAFNRFAQARVVPEDGMSETVNVIIHKASLNDAIAKLAKAMKRDWARVYALQAGFNMARRGPGGPEEPGGDGPRQFGMRRGADGDSNRPPQFGFGGPQMSDEQREEARKQREKLDEALKQTQPAEERRKMEDAQREREKLMEDMANMSPEQRRDRMMQMGGGNLDRMMRDRLMNSTPEQRAQMDKQMRHFRGPGGGGLGGPPTR